MGNLSSLTKKLRTFSIFKQVTRVKEKRVSKIATSADRTCNNSKMLQMYGQMQCMQCVFVASTYA